MCEQLCWRWGWESLPLPLLPTAGATLAPAHVPKIKPGGSEHMGSITGATKVDWGAEPFMSLLSHHRG